MNFRNQTMSPFREMNKSVFGRLNLGEPIFECSSDSGLETNRAASFPNIVSQLCSDPGGFFLRVLSLALFTNSLQVQSSCSQKGTTEAISRPTRITSPETPWIIARKVQIFRQSVNSIFKTCRPFTGLHLSLCPHTLIPNPSVVCLDRIYLQDYPIQKTKYHISPFRTSTSLYVQSGPLSAGNI